MILMEGETKIKKTKERRTKEEEKKWEINRKMGTCHNRSLSWKSVYF